MPMGIFLGDYGIRVNSNWVYKTKVGPLYGQLQNLTLFLQNFVVNTTKVDIKSDCEEHVYMYTMIHMIQHHGVNCLVTYKYQEWRC